MLEWVAYPLSRGSSEPYNQMGSFELQAYSLPAKQNSIFLIVQVFTNIPWIYKYTMDIQISQWPKKLIKGHKTEPQVESICQEYKAL